MKVKKPFVIYSVVWAALVALFNVLVFFIPAIPGQDKFTDSFWIGYAFVTVAFIGQFVCSYFAFKADNMKKLFYNASLITTSYIGLAATYIISVICMMLPVVPDWVAVVGCTGVLILNIISVAFSVGEVSAIEEIDKKVSQQTTFIKSMTAEASVLIGEAKTDDIKKACQKVHDALRYSDPMSTGVIAVIENNIVSSFAAFAKAVRENNAEEAETLASEVITLINKRNEKCKLLK